MTEVTPAKRLIIVSNTCPRLPRHIKLQHDEGRGRWVILAPERVFNPDDIAVDVLKHCDGQQTVTDIANRLAKEYQAPASEISVDIISLLQELADKGVVTT